MTHKEKPKSTAPSALLRAGRNGCAKVVQGVLREVKECLGAAIAKAGASLPHSTLLVLEVFQAFEDGTYYEGEGYCGVFEDFG
jgi:hypothetical protein